jgi:hypothetical protein
MIKSSNHYHFIEVIPNLSTNIIKGVKHLLFLYHFIDKTHFILYPIKKSYHNLLFNFDKKQLFYTKLNRTIPSLPVFLNIINALEIEVSDFFEGMQKPTAANYIVSRAEDNSIIEKEDDAKGFTYQYIFR